MVRSRLGAVAPRPEEDREEEGREEEDEVRDAGEEARDFGAEGRDAEVSARGVEADFEAAGRRAVGFAAVFFLAAVLFFAPAVERPGDFLTGLFLGVLTA